MPLCAVVWHCVFHITRKSTRGLAAPSVNSLRIHTQLVQKMATTEYGNFTGDPSLNSALPQDHIAQYNDPVLDPTHQHHHGHRYHDEHVGKDKEDEVVYSIGSPIDKSTIPDQTAHDHNGHKSEDIHQTDIEEVGDPQSQKPLGLYTRYRVFFHLLIWLFFTG